VRITLHERAGDVSIKFDAETEALRADLQSSAASLIEALRREQVPLANLDFASSPDRDPESRREDQGRSRAPRRAPSLTPLQDTIRLGRHPG
jgi:hypothetical protein